MTDRTLAIKELRQLKNSKSFYFVSESIIAYEKESCKFRRSTAY